MTQESIQIKKAEIQETLLNIAFQLGFHSANNDHPLSLTETPDQSMNICYNKDSISDLEFIPVYAIPFYNACMSIKAMLNRNLHFIDNGRFTILFFDDIHESEKDPKTVALMIQMFDQVYMAYRQCYDQACQDIITKQRIKEAVNSSLARLNGSTE